MSKIAQSLNLDSVVSRDSALPATRVDDELVVLNIATGRYIGLDDIGRTVWDRIERPVRIGDLCEALASDYRASVDEISGDVLDFLRGLAAEALILTDG